MQESGWARKIYKSFNRRWCSSGDISPSANRLLSDLIITSRGAGLFLLFLLAHCTAKTMPPMALAQKASIVHKPKSLALMLIRAGS